MYIEIIICKTNSMLAFLKIEMSINEMKAQKSSIKDVFLPYNLRPSLLMIALMLFQQLSGMLT